MTKLLPILLLTACGHWQLNPYMDISGVVECRGKVDKYSQTQDYACASAVGEAEWPKDYTEEEFDD